MSATAHAGATDVTPDWDRLDARWQSLTAKSLLRSLHSRGAVQPPTELSSWPLQSSGSDRGTDRVEAGQLAQQLPLVLPGGLCMLDGAGPVQRQQTWLERLGDRVPTLCLVVGGGWDVLKKWQQLQPGLVYVPVGTTDALAFLRERGDLP